MPGDNKSPTKKKKGGNKSPRKKEGNLIKEESQKKLKKKHTTNKDKLADNAIIRMNQTEGFAPKPDSHANQIDGSHIKASSRRSIFDKGLNMESNLNWQ